ncbi:bifunctional DNA primase/polymerase [Ancylothrix sp. C2]|uniref:PriCT-2 domain-containing protein n=1 Tax=Ancylothrix sp. D3o TaxID=2953691 RepID=UPI0021BA977C|nr:PriCT-2 domain-containing protein [Ancylothrix sp. D3o]MCT7953363.1 bifunctional DNA primase/polymerase [Ancylothrix sp. D3o]
MQLKSITLHDTLEETLLILPQHWLIIPVGYNKRPLGYNWPSRAMPVEKFISELGKFNSIPILTKTGDLKRIYPPGIGLLTGPNSQEILIAVDIDGKSAERKLEEISGDNIPPTVSFTSGRPHRRQLLFSAQLGMELRSQKIPTGIEEGLELRTKNLQSVLPPSPHPITGCYKWVAGLSPRDIEVAPAPYWLLDLLCQPVNQNKPANLVKFQRPTERHATSHTTTGDPQYSKYTGYTTDTSTTAGYIRYTGLSKTTNLSTTGYTGLSKTTDFSTTGCTGLSKTTDFSTTGCTDHPQYTGHSTIQNNSIRTARFLLTQIHPKYADDYDWWIKVGMALKFISPSLLEDWDKWSRLSPKYKAGECDYKWHSFNGRGITDRTLYWLARQF